MIGIYKQGENIAYGVKKFLCDTESDILNLPKEKPDAYPGSQALIISTSEVYVLNNQKVWVKLNLNTGSGGDGDIIVAGDDGGLLRFF